MAILWSAAEIEEFETRSGAVANASSAYARSSYARAAMQSGAATAYLHHAFGNKTDVWVSFRMARVSSWTGTQRVFGFTDGGVADANNKIALTGNASSYLRLVKYDGVTETQLAVGSVALDYTSPTKIDVHVSGLGTASTTINVYVSGSLYLTYTGDLSSICPHVDGIWFGMSAASATVMVSEVIVASESTLRMSLATLAPNGAVSSTWDGGAYTDVDEVVENTGDTLFSGTAAQEFLCDVTPVTAGTFNVRAVKVVARATRGDAGGPTQLALGIEQGGTTAWGSDQSLDVAYAAYEEWWTTNPDTSSAFTTSELATLRIGAKSVA